MGITDSFKKISGLRIFILLAIGGFMFYLFKISSPVLNFDTVKQTMIYDATSYVVPQGVNFFHVIVIVGLSVWLAIASSKDTVDMITSREAETIVLKEVEYRAKTLLLPEFEGITKITGIARRDDHFEDKNVPFAWVVGTVTVKGNEAAHYHVIIVDMKGFIKDVLESEEEFSSKDTCFKCGTFYDVKPLTPESLKTFMKYRQAFGRMGQ
jgi:hypothetical protein